MLVNKDTFLIEVEERQVGTIGIKGINENIRIDTDYNKYKHSTQIGKVFATPIKITSQYHNDTEIKEGDTVVFHHFICHPDHKTTLGENIYRAEYFHIYGKMKDRELIPIEDIIFVDPILEPLENMYRGPLQIKPHRENLPQQGIVFAASKKARAAGVEVGDKIFFTKDADYSMRITESLLYRMRTRNIVVIERGGKLICLKGMLLVKQHYKESKVGVLFSVRKTNEIFGEVCETGEGMKGVQKGDIVSYFNGAAGSLEYGGNVYSLIELRHINYITNGN